jgi:site-specific DNA recombinase
MMYVQTRPVEAMPVPLRTAAMYVRMSTDHQKYSTENQADAIRAYAERFNIHITDTYTDAGKSGLSLDGRDSLKRLIEDVQEGKVQFSMILVLDVTRWGRFQDADESAYYEYICRRAGIDVQYVAEQFENDGSPVTLNVLLSFAQFEREVTGERIRDKVAASKAKGIWMGGCVPLGYDLAERKLLINIDEAKLVRHIYERYVTLKSANQLIEELRNAGITTKTWTSRRGITKGGKTFMSGALYYLLGNRIYLGEIVHKGKSHPGNHEPIISHELWENVQAIRKENRY